MRPSDSGPAAETAPVGSGSSGPSRKTLQRRIWPWALGLGPVAAVISLAVMSREWFFNTAGWIDPWIYRALIQDWGNPAAWEGNYKASRLGWVVPAWLFSPVTNGYWGQIVFGAALLVGGGWLVGAAINRLIGPGAGVVAGVLTSAWSALMFLGGPSYHNTIVPLWFGLAMVSLAAAGDSSTTRRRRGLLVLAGVGAGMLVHANPITVNLLPLLLIAAVAAAPSAWRTRFRTYARSLMWAAAGAVAATTALSLTALAVGRSPWFFIDGIRLAAETAGNQERWYVALDGSWLSNPGTGLAWHLVLPAVGFVSAAGVIAALLVRRKWRSRPQHMLLSIGVVATSLIYLGWHLVGQTSLNPDYFAFGLILSSAIGVALAARWDEVDRRPVARTYWLVAPFWGLIFALCMALVPIMPAVLRGGRPEFSWFLAAGLGIGGVTLLVASGRRGTALFLVAAGALGMANLVATARYKPNEFSTALTSRAINDRDHVSGRSCAGAAGAFDQQIVQIKNEFDRAYPGQRAAAGIPMWYPSSLRDRPMSSCFYSIPASDGVISAANAGGYLPVTDLGNYEGPMIVVASRQAMSTSLFPDASSLVCKEELPLEQFGQPALSACIGLRGPANAEQAP